MKLERILHPVGQGGFSVEIIKDFCIVYDCGSISSYSMIESCIDHFSRKVKQVDVLFISHFDKDHVNGIRYLINSVPVKKAVTSYIPKELRVVFDLATNGAYTAILGILRERQVTIDEVGEDGGSKPFPCYDICNLSKSSGINGTY